jgi:hypothetical protein
MRSLSLALLAAIALSGCGASRFSREGGGASRLTARAVDWNRAHADLGPVRAVADAGDTVVVFGDGQATILSAGVVVAVDHSVARWTAAGAIPAADGNGIWIVGIDGEGRVLRLRNTSSFEGVSERWGLEREKVRSVAVLAPGTAGFLLASELAVADGQRVTRYATGPVTSISGGGGRVALLGDPGLRLLALDPDPQRTAAHAFTLPEPITQAALGADGRLFVAAREALYGEDESGNLALRFEAGGTAIHGLVASGARLWFADGAELGTLEGGVVRETTGAKLSPEARLIGSPSGDVWAIQGDHTLLRFSAEDGVESGWEETIAPVFQRSCSACHLPGGSAGLDLSTREAWAASRAPIRQRVLVDRSMPPAGHPLADADREAIGRWLEPAH